MTCEEVVCQQDGGQLFGMNPLIKDADVVEARYKNVQVKSTCYVSGHPEGLDRWLTLSERAIWRWLQVHCLVGGGDGVGDDREHLAGGGGFAIELPRP